MEIKKEYIKFVENYIPFEWEIDKTLKINIMVNILLR